MRGNKRDVGKVSPTPLDRASPESARRDNRLFRYYCVLR